MRRGLFRGLTVNDKIYFPVFDIDGNESVYPEEIYAVSQFHETTLALLQFSETAHPKVDDRRKFLTTIVEKIIERLDAFDQLQQADPTGVTPMLESPPTEAYFKFFNLMLSVYRQLPPKERAYFREQFLAFKANLKSDQPFDQSEFSQEMLEQSKWLLHNHNRIEPTDGNLGISLEEVDYYQPYFKQGLKTPNPSFHTSAFKPDNPLKVHNTLAAIKQCIKIKNPKLKKSVYQILDKISQSETGYKLLEAIKKQIDGGMPLKISLMTPAKMQELGSQTVGYYEPNNHSLMLSPIALEHNPEMMVEVFCHELFHAIPHIRPHGNQGTVREETMANDIGQLVGWELGLSLYYHNTLAHSSYANKYDAIWNLYSHDLYLDTSPADIRSSEAGFQSPEWEDYITTQMTRIFEGLWRTIEPS